MSIHAIFDANGFPTAFYASDVTPDIPSDAVGITVAQWSDCLAHQGQRRWDGRDVVPYDPPQPPVAAPDNPTLSDWRVALTLWKRPDGSLRIDEVTKKVADLVAAGHPMGRIARERLEYANNVLRAQLMQLKDALGFSADDVDESLWRAAQVAKGDLSGVWPLKG